MLHVQEEPRKFLPPDLWLHNIFFSFISFATQLWISKHWKQKGKLVYPILDYYNFDFGYDNF